MHWNWHQHQLTIGIMAGIVITAAIARITHTIRRMLERRCKICGGLRMRTTHFLCPSASASYEGQSGKHYDTFTFRECRWCWHLDPKSDTRFMSVWAIMWRKCFKRHHFTWSDDIGRLFADAGWDKPGTSMNHVFIEQERALKHRAMLMHAH